jgi:hypothetical protein
MEAYELASFTSIEDLKQMNNGERVRKLMDNIAKDDFATFAQVLGVIKECKEEEEKEAYIEELAEETEQASGKNLLHKCCDRVIFQRDLKYLRCLLELDFPLYHEENQGRSPCTYLLQRIDSSYI